MLTRTGDQGSSTSAVYRLSEDEFKTLDNGANKIYISVITNIHWPALVWATLREGPFA